MVKCKRCGTGFGPSQAAVLEFCPRCKARDNLNIRLVVWRSNSTVTIAGVGGRYRAPAGA